MTNTEAIKYLKQLKYDYNPLCPQREALRLAIRALEERPKGKWIYILRDSENDEYRCSNCDYPQGYNPNFCPNCGADMRGDENA